MKIVLSKLAVVLICLIFFNISAQNTKFKEPLKGVVYKDNVKNSLTVKELNQLEEVYGDALEQDVLSRPQRLKSVKNILRNRVKIVEISNHRNQKSCKLLSEVPLFDAYVKTLERDAVFNKNDFNPLKYLFPFYGNKTEIFRVDNTDYFIIIKSQFTR